MGRVIKQFVHHLICCGRWLAIQCLIIYWIEQQNSLLTRAFKNRPFCVDQSLETNPFYWWPAKTKSSKTCSWSCIDRWKCWRWRNFSPKKDEIEASGKSEFLTFFRVKFDPCVWWECCCLSFGNLAASQLPFKPIHFFQKSCERIRIV